MRSWSRTAVIAFSAGLLALTAQANLITGNETQLETWLGQGKLDFTNIFTKTNGDGKRAQNFHAAVDAKGPTITLMSLFNIGDPTTGELVENSRQIIGGYDPFDWGSVGGYNVNLDDSDRTAFIFNLSNATIQRQNLVGQGDSDSGQWQTFDVSFSGPNFGIGDIYTSWSLEIGEATNYSYGGTSHSSNIIWGGGVDDLFEIASIEVYTFAPSAVPEVSSTLGLMTFSFAGLILLRRRCLS